MSHETREAVAAKWRCGSCGGIRPGTKIIDATIQEQRFGNAALNFVFGFDLGVARKDFLAIFGEEELQKSLYIGKLFSEERGLLDDWVTFHGKQRIFVRGSTHTQYRECSGCGSHLYFGMGKQYLCPQPTKNIKIFHGGNSSLIVTEDLTEKITLNSWEKLKCEKLQVLDKPLDGFPVLLSP